MTIFVGIDLAWGAKNDSGVCVVSDDGCLVYCRPDAPEALAAMLDDLGPDVVVGIDAPLVVGASRRAEALLASRMGKAGVYAHSSVAAVRAGRDRGLQLCSLLRERRFRIEPCMRPREAGRFAFEVYPHAGHVVLFGLQGIMRYKQKKGRTAESLNAALELYRRELRTWLEREWPQSLRHEEVTTLLSAVALRGTARKRHEDALDALTCAMMARAAWEHGLGPGDVLGDVQHGYIAVPGLSRDPRFDERRSTGPGVTSARALSSP